MDRNYEIAEGIYLVQAGHELDLHNDFEFRGLSYSVEERKVLLSWERSSGDWVRPGTPKELVIEFNKVSEFRFMPRDSELPFSEDSCIEFIGYWVDEEWPEGFFMVEPGRKIEPHWLTAIEFMSGAVLAVQAESANAKITA